MASARTTPNTRRTTNLISSKICCSSWESLALNGGDVECVLANYNQLLHFCSPRSKSFPKKIKFLSNLHQ